MTKSAADIMELKHKAFDLVATSRQQLQHGSVDLSPVEVAIRNYCEALAAMPVEEGRKHVQELQSLTEAMNEIEHELTQARDGVRYKLAELSRLRVANSAYIKTDNIGTKYVVTDNHEDEE